MSGRVVALASCWYGLLSSAAFAFSVDGSYVTRAFSQQVVLTNSSIQVTATFTNLGTNLLRGFSYLEQIPSTLSVTTLSVSLGGRDLTNFTFESGQDGDVYAGCTPRRWVLETPTNFAEANPLPPQAGVQIVYSLVCSSAGTFALQNFSWAGGTLGAADAVFGYSESSALRMVKFITTTNSPLLSGERSTNGFALWIDGLPGSIYLLTASTNLVNWVPLATNLSLSLILTRLHFPIDSMAPFLSPIPGRGSRSRAPLPTPFRFGSMAWQSAVTSSRGPPTFSIGFQS
jgi:hypothetical protein